MSSLVDDSNTAVQYSHNWTWVPNLVPEVDHTRHGVSEAGQTASLTFTGTGIQVFGTLEPSDVAGQPTTQYAIDGSVVTTYTAPFTPSGPAVLNVTFFSKLDLSPDGDHTILITNVNGTSPNMFWLDFFLVYTSPSQDPTGSSGVAAATATSSGNSGSRTISVKTAGAIIGGVAGALVLIIVLLVAYIVRMKSRHKRSARLIQPFNATAEDGTTPVVSPRRKAGSPPILPSPTASESAPSAGPSSAAAMSALGPVVSISASRVNVASSTGALSENRASATYPRDRENEASSDYTGAGLLARPSHHDRPGPSRAPDEALSLSFTQSLLHAVAHGQGARRQDKGLREGPPGARSVALDSGLRLYNEGMLPPSYSSS
ncbi:hypothetical protein LXA43DRAFT_248408 [Ganoderma leucocontextum]|nr:hypothetical protein LXA43DRAFT_248408 [Ganoderma leucocontextum]